MSESAKWYEQIVAGDMVLPKPLWNKTERPSSHLSFPTTAIGVKYAQSQTGVMFAVKTKNGIVRELDAGWFLPPTDKQETVEQAMLP